MENLCGCWLDQVAERFMVPVALNIKEYQVDQVAERFMVYSFMFEKGVDM